MNTTIGALALLAVALAGAFAGSGAVLAQGAPPQSQIPPGLSQNAAGQFKVIEIATTESASFLAAWKERKDQVSLPTNGTVERRQQISTYIIFTGCKVDARGSCNVTNDFEVYDPDGGVYAKRGAQPQWLGEPAPDGKIMLGTAGLGLIVENGEKLGVYRIRSFTTDKVANVTVNNEIAVTVVEAR